MKKIAVQIIAGLALTGIYLGLAGCGSVCHDADRDSHRGSSYHAGEPKRVSRDTDLEHSWTTFDRKNDVRGQGSITSGGWVVDFHPNTVEDPAPSAGTINILPGSLVNNSSTTGCFPSSSGWDKYYATGWFLGPGGTATPNNYPNAESKSNITIDTLSAANGTGLDTGILINYEFNPNDKVCNDDVGSSIWPGNSKLSKATKPMNSKLRYRLTVFFKSSTIGSLTNIVVNWKYE